MGHRNAVRLVQLDDHLAEGPPAHNDVNSIYSISYPVDEMIAVDEPAGDVGCQLLNDTRLQHLHRR